MTFGDKVKQAAKAWDGSLQLIEQLEARGELMLEIPQTLTLIERAFKRFKVSVTVDD
jgi:hypothetical protein